MKTLQKVLERFADANGGIALDDGRVWSGALVTRETINKRVLDVAARKLAVATGRETSDVKSEFTEELFAAGALERSVSKRYEERKGG